MPCMKLGHIVKALREGNGWSLEQLAAYARKNGASAKLKHQSIQQLEKNPLTKPRFERPMAAAFGKTVEELNDWRPGMPFYGPNSGKAAPVSLTEEGSDEDASPDLQILRLRNAVTSLRMAVGSMAVVLASSRPDEAEDVAALFRKKSPANFQDMGMGLEFLSAIDAAVAVARANASSRRRKGG